ncbi:cation channel sperm-associated protein 2 [Eublepharis macularius]|uniref:Cation channel sperm-associated protein 2 n=1 Tax=Eublepharis macularius TaxID=481883 RepID=A0AA97JPH4_EUBMA|nr:cation channel sperm-associated protein 2 [Eublepharis macularius]
MIPSSSEESLRASPKCKKKQFQLHPRGDAIRSKLIYTFYLIDHLKGLSHAVPRHNIRDFLDHKKLKKLMLTDHNQLVRFRVVPTRNILITKEKRWRNRIQVRCSRFPPLSMWAYWILRSKVFKGFMIFLICLNMVVLMMITEIARNTKEHFQIIKMVLEVAIWVIILIFILEIGLHWIVGFRKYWRNPWNIFDFIVTMASFIPELIFFTTKASKSTTKRIVLVFRVLRCLKLFPRVRQVRVIIMAITKALRAMAFILLLLVFFFYVFAVAGIFFFESYTRSDRNDLEYSMYFKDMPNALVTIFILFTMDHWYALLQDSWKVPGINKFITGMFIILWLLIGAFIFRNLFVAIMVANFQNIRNDLIEEMKQLEAQKQADRFKLEIIESRFSPSQIYGDAAQKSQEKVVSEIASGIPSTETPDYSQFGTGPLDWESYVYKNLPGLYQADDDEQVVWPRDSLFRYFELMEKLQYNLEERQQLQHYAALALSNLEDK